MGPEIIDLRDEAIRNFRESSRDLKEALDDLNAAQMRATECLRRRIDCSMVVRQLGIEPVEILKEINQPYISDQVA